MSDTETPIEAGARAVVGEMPACAAHTGGSYCHWCIDDARRYARTAFASVDVDGLAEVLRAHQVDHIGDNYLVCRRCGGIAAGVTVTQHQAEAQKRWLTGGGA